MLPLACSVRDCGLALDRKGPTFMCARRHTYDVSRSGYVNLLQPHDRRSLAAGDPREAIVARARLLGRGVGAQTIATLADRVAQLVQPGDVVADLGSGAGELLAAIHERAKVSGIGIDLSTAAAEHAAKRYPHLTWVVANADRRLPLLDRTIDVTISLHGRRNPDECARVLTNTGRLIVAVPAPDDLRELRAEVQGEAVERDRAQALEQEHLPLFRVVERFELREEHDLPRDALRDLLRGTYRGNRLSDADKVEALDRLRVTLASTVLVFERASGV
jgi:23S rRNA (guanine745-N1)-methyltransferase